MKPVSRIRFESLCGVVSKRSLCRAVVGALGFRTGSQMAFIRWSVRNVPDIQIT
jgi:hypothetical protein